MAKPTISIIIPVYNEERHLAACLDAIAAQTVAPAEVLVVDNNSTDSTLRIARKYPFVTVLHEPRQGIVFARNTGFDNATGSVLARIDADTVLPKIWVSSLERIYSEVVAPLAVTGPCNFYNVPLPAFVRAIHRLTYFGFSRLLLGHSVLFGSNMAISRNSWLAVREHTCMTNTFHEDTDLSVHLDTYCKFMVSPELIADVEYRMPRNPVSFIKYVFAWLRTLVHRRTIRP